MLAFDAAAELTLSDGTTCTVEAPHSLVRAKGYKHAVPDSQVQGGSYRMLSRLDAGAAANGYVEE